MGKDKVEKETSPEDIFDCNDLSKFVSTISYTIPVRGYSRSKFYMCNFGGTRFLTKLSYYYKTMPELYGTVNKLVISQTDAEIKILNILNERIINTNISPCILELVYYMICGSVKSLTPGSDVCRNLKVDFRAIKPVEDIMDSMCRYWEQIKAGLAYNKCAFMVLDVCDMSFDDYLQKTPNTPASIGIFKSLLFQIIFTLFAITKIFPEFKHNDLHTDNIMLKIDNNYIFRADQPRFLSYSDGKRKYYVPYFGIIPKIIDFGFSVIPEAGIVSNIVDELTIMFRRPKSDILVLFHWIYRSLYMSNREKMRDVDRILRVLEPTATYTSEHYYIEARDIDIMPFSEMITNKIFAEYGNKPSDESIIAEYNAP